MSGNDGETSWKFADLVVKSIGAAMIGGAITLVGYWLDTRQREVAEDNARLRAIVEFASSQKTLDVNLEMQLLEKFIDHYLKPSEAGSASRKSDEMLVLLRLIALNFQDVPINLKPLFQDLDRRMAGSDSAESSRLRQDLRQAAKEVANRQAFRLSYVGGFLSKKRQIKLGEEVSFLDEGIPLLAHLTNIDPDGAEIEIRVEGADRRYGPIWTSFYDMPVLDNIKIDNDTRVSLLLDGIDGQVATIRMLSFIGDLAADRFDIKEMTRELYTHRR